MGPIFLLFPRWRKCLNVLELNFETVSKFANLQLPLSQENNSASASGGFVLSCPPRGPVLTPLGTLPPVQLHLFRPASYFTSKLYSSSATKDIITPPFYSFRKCQNKHFKVRISLLLFNQFIYFRPHGSKRKVTNWDIPARKCLMQK